MKIEPFETEHYFSQYEFRSEHLLSVSDCEPLSVEALFRMSGTALDALSAVKLGYREANGTPEFRTAIASMYDHVSPEDVVVLGSPVEGIYLAMRALLERSDEAIVLSPAYDALSNLPRHIANVVRWPLRPRPDSWELDWDLLDSIATPATRLLVINFPHNPTGFVPTTEEFSRLLAWAADRNVVVFSDEMYRGLELSKPTLPSACERSECSVTLCGLSKTHGLPGLRAGWLVIRDPELRAQVLNWKMYTSICPPVLTEVLGRIALLASEEIVTQNRARIAYNVSVAERYFSNRDGVTWRAPEGGTVTLLETTYPDDSVVDYCHRLARDSGVLLLPGTFLGSPVDAVRLGFGRTSFERDLEAFKSA